MAGCFFQGDGGGWRWVLLVTLHFSWWRRICCGVVTNLPQGQHMQRNEASICHLRWFLSLGCLTQSKMHEGFSLEHAVLTLSTRWPSSSVMKWLIVFTVKREEVGELLW
jgi:hypothetical protein